MSTLLQNGSIKGDLVDALEMVEKSTLIHPFGRRNSYQGW